MTDMTNASTWLGVRPVVNALGDIWDSCYVRFKEYTKETVEHLILAVFIYCVVCVLLYLGITKWNVVTFKSGVKNPKRVLFVIAHPDDECMFFGPTVLHFTRQPDCAVYLMCLSTGQNYGMGKTRKRELYDSCRVLGIEEGSIIVHNHTLLPDSMDTIWPMDLLANLVLQVIEIYDITTVVTFDRHGVSRHANHCSIYYALAHLTLQKRLPKDCNVYVLETVNIIRKYWSMFDIPLCFLLSRTRYIINWSDRILLQHAMQQHKSQFLWFRRLYIMFSRYMVINTFHEMDVADLQLELDMDED